MRSYPHRLVALQMLVLCCVFWGLSFPLIKALHLVGLRNDPASGTVFLSALSVIYRFGMGGIVIAAVLGKRLFQITPSEAKQGLGIGLFGSLGLVLQLDALAYTSASVSAFLTQAYCVLIPLWLAARRRVWPTWVVWIACGLAIAGAAVLSGLGTERFSFGRGEWETLASSCLFTGQILWLEKSEFRGNHVLRFSVVMFFVNTLVCAPIAWMTQPRWESWWTAFGSPSALAILAALTALCTLFTYLMMNRWQPEVPATEAGLIYCAEPVFASAFALFFPAILSQWVGIAYINEHLTMGLIVGGMLILTANLWIQWRGSGE